MKTDCKNLKIAWIVALSFCFISFSSCKKDGEITENNPATENLPDITDYPIVTTNQTTFFNNTGEISEPASGDAFYGQDANYTSTAQSYVDNGDGTVTDMVTGLMWQQAQTDMLWNDAETNAKNATTGGYIDWRVPTIKELYSLIDFTGNQGKANPSSTTAPSDAIPFINTDYFDFSYPSDGLSRYIDVQFISKTTYGGIALGSSETFFGLNLADGRVKAYPQSGNLSNPEFAARFVRGNVNYGVNDFIDNNDGTITDNATGLMWSTYDSGNDTFSNAVSSYTNTDGSMNWEEALNFAEDITFSGYSDWRLPTAKELHSILDYNRSPDATNSPAIDPVFETTDITNEAGQSDYPAFWSSTTFEPGEDGVIIFFGRALGYVNGEFIDVHGAGCQRTDLKTGTPSYGNGPQGDVRRIYNYVRLVRSIN